MALQCALQLTLAGCRKYKSPSVLETWTGHFQWEISSQRDSGFQLFFFFSFRIYVKLQCQNCSLLKISLYKHFLETNKGRTGQPNPRLISRGQLCLSFNTGREKTDIEQSLADKLCLSLKDETQ